MNTQTKVDTEESLTEFLLAEYTTLREFRSRLDVLGESRLNFFLATISGAIIGLGLLNQLSALSQTLAFINSTVFIGLFLLGLMTFARMVERTIRITEYTRGMNRIRRYFADKHPEITPYLWLSLHDDMPAFGQLAIHFQTRRLGLTGLAPTVGVINSIIATLGLVIFTRVVFLLPIPWSVLIGTFTFLLLVFAHYHYLLHRLKHKQNETEVRFPTPQKESLNPVFENNKST